MLFFTTILLTRRIILFKITSKMFLLLGALQEDYGIICKMLFLRKEQRISATEKKHFQILHYLMLKNTAFHLLRHLFSLIIYCIPQKTTLRTQHSRPNATNAKEK